jgi:hypothetical protein
MTSSSESAGVVLALFLLLQLVGFLALLIGGMYMLSCLQRAANGLDRLASVAEEWLQRQPVAPPVPMPVPPSYPTASYLPTPGTAEPSAPVPPVSSHHPGSPTL